MFLCKNISMISIKVTPNKLYEIAEYYKDYYEHVSDKNILFVALKNGVRITGYNSKKTYRKVVFNGEGSADEVKIWDDGSLEAIEGTTPSKGWVDLDDQIGSDEVGVGDFLLPMVVVATYIQKKDIQKLKNLGVNDSKKLSDEKIKNVAKKLITFVEYSKLTLPNDKFNEAWESQFLKSEDA